MSARFHYDFSIQGGKNQHIAAQCDLFHTFDYLYAIAAIPPPAYILITVHSIPDGPKMNIPFSGVLLTILP
jgi:hypothetical protein